MSELTLREKFGATLKERAESITSVRNDVYTTKYWQFLLNFAMGGGALATLITTMLTSGTASVVCAVVGVVLVVCVVVFNYALRAVAPVSFLQYIYKDKDKCYYFMVLSKTRSAFSDGINHIEVDRGEVSRLEKRTYPQYGYDFFAYMNADERVLKDGKETYRGTITEKGKRRKCKIVFKDGVPVYGNVNGARIKYFDVNNTKDKFVVPAALKRSVKEQGVSFPKVPGLYVRDDVRDATKQ